MIGSWTTKRNEIFLCAPHSPQMNIEQLHMPCATLKSRGTLQYSRSEKYAQINRIHSRSVCRLHLSARRNFILRRGDEKKNGGKQINVMDAAIAVNARRFHACIERWMSRITNSLGDGDSFDCPKTSLACFGFIATLAAYVNEALVCIQWPKNENQHKGHLLSQNEWDAYIRAPYNPHAMIAMNKTV